MEGRSQDDAAALAQRPPCGATQPATICFAGPIAQHCEGCVRAEARRNRASIPDKKRAYTLSKRAARL